LQPKAFLAGDWRRTRPGQSGLNGLLWAWADDLFAVGGWDERIEGYGWDDSDLLSRLGASGLLRQSLAPGSVFHLQHSDSERLGNQGLAAPLPPRVHTQVNRVRTSQRTPWLRGNLIGNREYQLYGPEVQKSELDRWLGARIAVQDDFHPMKARARTLFRTSLAPLLARAGSFLSTARWRGAPKLILVQPKHGLGNRLRVLASAVLIAEAEQAKLVVAWIPDDHCGASLHDLLDFRGEVISSEAELSRFVRDKRVSILNLLDDIDPHHKGQNVRLRSSATFIRSSSVIRHDSVSDDALTRTMRSWAVSDAVQRQLDEIGGPFDLAVHVRQGNYAGVLTPSYEKATSNWSRQSEAMIRKSRELTSPDVFSDTLESLLPSGHRRDEVRVYLATDSIRGGIQVRDVLRNFGVVAIKLGGNGEDRSRDGVIRAMADCVVLSQANEYVGSNYSAFTEFVLALRNDYTSFSVVGTETAPSAPRQGRRRRFRPRLTRR
jgi:hypothetical protein